MTFLFWLALVTLLALLAITVEFALGNRSFNRLSQVPTLADSKAPRVSVIVAARNEARNLEAALQSLLHQNYPNIEFVVVNDRSTDDTGRILDRMAKTDTRLRVIHLNELPKGWLGKNHALHLGAAQATGELLLFSDADVVMEPTTISRAVNYVLSAKVDHVAVGPQITGSNWMLEVFCGAFTILFGLYAKPWKARDPKSSRHIGIGAFNLFRAEVYRAVGGHAPISMRPDDDMKLGKLIKKSGYRQEMVLGDGFVTVEWYSSVGELARGLEKNSFAGVEYRLVLIALATVAQLAVFVWPIIAAFVTTGSTQWLNIACVVVTMMLFVDNARFHGVKPSHAIGFPFAILLFLFILWRATLKTLLQDGISWRDTHYSLRELKANKL
jgi:glycosyltransferase involved in cell wall biosynthesis